ncbi:hypothetical protein EDM59_30730 [Brevibacillus nitrificans]|uniref:Peptidase M10 metallopeptidase domain-containing protein n=1 Tax=Brevibacillus nitrificans TaxID=651560 RepID=A0A3M8CPR7_9BACL|nr:MULTISPECIES: matrixin family metalloprotease [Brevibacillus]MED1949759.1 matrixin family metalloprotease [Brevibacillus centrosporus]RNB77762.1 hypothetical protein EDM59_30730 [Brevibacillus nitrificans]
MRKWILGLVLLLSLSTIVNADYTNSDAFWAGGGYENTSTYNNIEYWVEGEAESKYGTYINDAISDYSSISGVDFGFSEGDDFFNSDLYILVTEENDIYHGMGGVMVPCDWSGGNCNEVGTNTRWDAAGIFIFDDYMNSNNYSSNERNKVIVHEFGHLYALRHQTQANSVMYPERTTITSPTSLDISNLQWKY